MLWHVHSPAQMDRVPDSDSGGRGFESRRAYQIKDRQACPFFTASLGGLALYDLTLLKDAAAAGGLGKLRSERVATGRFTAGVHSLRRLSSSSSLTWRTSSFV